MRVMVGQEINLRTAGFNEVQTDNFVIKYTSKDEEYINTVVSAAEQSFTEVTELFGYTPVNKTTVVIYPDTASLAKSFGWDKDEKAMGVYWGGSIRILSPSEWVRGNVENEFYKEGPMVHEFTHLIVDDLTKGNYNRWWTEGIAQYVEKKITGFQFASPFTDGKLIEYYNINELEKEFDQLDQQRVYWQSLKMVEYIVENYGEESLFLILDNLGQGNNMSKALEKALVVSYDTFVNDFYTDLEINN